MLQASLFHPPPFCLFTFEQDGLTPSGVNVGGCEVFQALVIAPMVVVADERRHVILEITGQEVVFQQDSVLQRLMPALDLALGLRMIGRTARVRHTFVFQIISQAG